MPLEHAKIRNELTGDEFDVLFNPEEYSINKDNNFASQAIPGLESPILQFVHGNLRTLDMELFFDTTDDQSDVRAVVSQITDLLQVDWGSLHFRCVLAKANQKFLRFLPTGFPCRARVTVTFHEYLDAEAQVAAANLQTADYSKVHVVKQGETLSSIADAFYEDALQWRPIAVANGIVRPRSIGPGLALRIPALPFVDPSTGEVLQ
jgi:LysM repeat protein